jgi:hypothetical protein
VKFAYADPPYPGKSQRYYSGHPDYAGEVDHAALIERLCRDYPDGWALSTSAAAVRRVLILCPPDVRMAVWHSTSSKHPGGRADNWWNVWEPLILRGGRRLQSEATATADVLTCGRPSAGFTGAKPEAFSWWMFRLLGARADDTLDDLFPGSGAIGCAWDGYVRQPELSTWGQRRKCGVSKAEEARRLEKKGLLSPLL